MPSLFKIIRNNWKKTIFFGFVGYYGTSFFVDRRRTFGIMREFGIEATKYGKKPLVIEQKPKHITVLLNPVAGNRNGKENFEKYAEPLLHLSGYLVNVVKTEKISEGRELAEIIEKTNVIGVAGGDGTLMEVITGLLRRDDADEALQRFPVALIPLGLSNKFAKKFLNFDSTQHKASIALAAMSVPRHKLRPMDVVKVELIPENAFNVDEMIRTAADDNPFNSSIQKSEKENPSKFELSKKPYYVMSGLEFGQFQNAFKKEEQMPRFLFKKLRTLWSLFRTSPFRIKAEIRYRQHCEGCANCKEDRQIKSNQRSVIHRVLSAFGPHRANADVEDLKWSLINPDCGKWESLCIDSPEINVLTQGNGRLELQIGKELSTTQFIVEGYRRKYFGQKNVSQRIICEEIEIYPISSHQFFAMDNEEFPTKPIRMKILRNKVYFFVPK